MAANAWQVYDSFVPTASDLLTDTFYLALFKSTYTPADTDDSYTTINSDEVANGLGYVTGGVALTSVAYTDTAGVTTFTADNATFTASGGSIVARYAVIYNSTDAGKQLVALCLMDNTPADITVPDGLPLNITLTTGVFNISGGW